MTKQREYSEELSAWFDGEVSFEASRQRLVLSDPVLRQRWGTYALIGAALRGEALSLPNDGFVDRLLERLAAEMPPTTEQAGEVPQWTVNASSFSDQPAANAPRWRGWGVAAAVAFLGLGLWWVGASLPGSVPPVAHSVSVSAPAGGLSDPIGRNNVQPVGRVASRQGAPWYVSVHHPLQPAQQVGSSRYRSHPVVYDSPRP